MLGVQTSRGQMSGVKCCPPKIFKGRALHPALRPLLLPPSLSPFSLLSPMSSLSLFSLLPPASSSSPFCLKNEYLCLPYSSSVVWLIRIKFARAMVAYHVVLINL